VTWGEVGRDLPGDWHKLVAQVKKRARLSSPTGIEQCEKLLPRSGRRCPRIGKEVDHIGANDDHRLHMLRLKCVDHHAPKTAAQGHQAWAAKKKKAIRPAEVHPGRVSR